VAFSIAPVTAAVRRCGAHQPIIPGRVRGNDGYAVKTTDAMATKPMVLNSFNES
jgi:hypothetical protein